MRMGAGGLIFLRPGRRHGDRRDKVATYSAFLAQALAELNAKALALVGTRYGLDSTEYELVGGKRTSERKRRRPAVG